MRHQEGGSKRLRHIGVCASDGDGQIGHISYGAAGAALGAGDTGQADSVSGQFVDVVIGVVAGVLPKARSGAESFQCRLDRRADPVDGQCHGDVRGGSHGAHVDTPSGLGMVRVARNVARRCGVSCRPALRSAASISGAPPLAAITIPSAFRSAVAWLMISGSVVRTSSATSSRRRRRVQGGAQLGCRVVDFVEFDDCGVGDRGDPCPAHLGGRGGHQHRPAL